MVQSSMFWHQVFGRVEGSRQIQCLFQLLSVTRCCSFCSCVYWYLFWIRTISILLSFCFGISLSPNTKSEEDSVRLLILQCVWCPGTDVRENDGRCNNRKWPSASACGLRGIHGVTTPRARLRCRCAGFCDCSTSESWRIHWCESITCYLHVDSQRQRDEHGFQLSVRCQLVNRRPNLPDLRLPRGAG